MSKIISKTEVRLSYENLIVPRSQNEGDDPTHSTMILVPKADEETVNDIRAAITEALNVGVSTKWNGKKPAGLKNPLRDGDEERPDDPNAKGMFFFNAKGPRGGQEAPFLYANNGRQIVPTDPDASSIVYSGVHGRVSLNFYPYDRNGNRGVAAGIVAFVSSERGERLDSRPTATSALADFGFDPLSAPAEAPKQSDSATTTVAAEEDPWG